MSQMSATNAHRKAAIIANGERIQTRIFTNRVRESRNVNKEITASANPGNQPVKKRHPANDHIFSMGINTSSPKGNPDWSKARMNSAKYVASVTQAVRARRKGKSLLRRSVIQTSP